MLFTLVGELPKHQYVWVDSAFTHREPRGFLEAVWFGLVSMRGRTWGCTVMLKSGAIYRNLPVHALALRSDPEPVWTPNVGAGTNVLSFGRFQNADGFAAAFG